MRKSSNHGPLCTSGPAGQGLNAGAAPTEPRPEPSSRQSQRSAETVALGQALALQRAELQQQQQQMAQRRAEQQQQQMAQVQHADNYAARCRSRSAVRSTSSAKGLANPEMRIRVTPSDVKTTLNLDVTASDNIEIVKDMIHDYYGTPVKQIRLYSGERELPDCATLQELHIEHLSRIIMRNDGEEVVRDGEQSKDGEEVVCDEAVGNPHHYHVVLLELTELLDESLAFLTRDYGAWHAREPLLESQLAGSNARICVRCRFCGAELATVCPNSSGELKALPCCWTMKKATQGDEVVIETVVFPHGAAGAPGVPSIIICVRFSKNLSKKWFAIQKLDMRFDFD